MLIKHIKFKDLTASNWAGGATYQYYIIPKNAIYADRAFDLRISCATITADQSDFTRFEGYRRHLVMLDNTLELVHNNMEKKFESLEIFTFDSEDFITSFSKGTDFNIMISKKHSGEQISIQRGKISITTKFVVLFSLSNAAVYINDEEHVLNFKDVLILKNENSIDLELTHKCIILEL